MACLETNEFDCDCNGKTTRNIQRETASKSTIEGEGLDTTNDLLTCAAQVIKTSEGVGAS
jgi:hypothetical protein